MVVVMRNWDMRINSSFGRETMPFPAGTAGVCLCNTIIRERAPVLDP